MIAFISLCYGAFYILFFNKLKLFDKTPKNISIFIGLGVVLVGAIVFSWWTVAPTTADARMFQYVVPIVPNVKGTVVEVPAVAMVPMNEGEVLYKIDPAPFQFSVDELEASVAQAKAQKRLAEIDMSWLVGLDGVARTVAIIAGAVPTASSAYVMARKMGGNAELMSSIVTFQVIAAFFTLPLFVYIADQL